VGCVDLFPHQLWGRLLRRVWCHSRNLLGKLNDPAGYKPLRQVICDYVSSSRGLNCTENQIIIVNGTQQAINLTAQVLLQKQDEVWLDEPGYDGALGVFTSVGATVRPVLSDEEGMDISYGIQNWPNAKLVFTAPSHQFPLGGTLSLSRRLALLDWVAENGKWILEDDYNSEFRYTARPIQALQGLDKHQRVIYAGTFSKMMFPEFRLGFLVVPTSLIEVFKLVKYYADTRSPHLEQAALALFISEGHYARHVRRIRKACYERKNILTKAIETYLPEKFRIHPSDSGIHIVCWLLGDLKEGQVIKRCREIGLEVQPLSRYSQKPLSKQGILIGYAAHTPIELVENIKKLSKLF
jgi:GntR family transcriptional regulator/MocR family aminotransferase